MPGTDRLIEERAVVHYVNSPIPFDKIPKPICGHPPLSDIRWTHKYKEITCPKCIVIRERELETLERIAKRGTKASRKKIKRIDSIISSR